MGVLKLAEVTIMTLATACNSLANVVMYYGVRGEAVKKRRGGGGGQFESRPWNRGGGGGAV